MNAVAVYCGSSAGVNPAYSEAARELGAEIARRGVTLVYGGGRVGLMGAVADACLAHGGRVVGVMPDFLVRREVAHQQLSELVVVETMHERKTVMAERADAFIAMPGGYGTLEEFTEALTWTQLGLHRKAHALLNTAGFFDALLTFFDHAQQAGFVTADARALVLAHHDPAALLDALARHGSASGGSYRRA